MAETLKPCPFCGGEAKEKPDADFCDYRIIQCDRCGVYHFGSRLVERWYRRTPGPATAAVLETCRRLLLGGPHDYDRIAISVKSIRAFLAEWEPRVATPPDSR